jgi:hypothetical protein
MSGASKSLNLSDKLLSVFIQTSPNYSYFNDHMKQPL